MRKDLGASRTTLKRMSAGGVVLALVALFGLPTAAFAAGPTVVDIPGGATGTLLTATDGGGEENAIAVGNTGPVAGGGISITDSGPPGAGVTLGAGATAAGCTVVGDQARCPLGDLTAATVSTGDLDDSVNVFNDDVVITVNAGAGEDDLRGGPGNDVLNGGADDDELRGGSGGDTLNGGTGGEVDGDLVDYGSASAAVQVILDGAANDGQDTNLVLAGIQPEGDNVTEAEIVEGSSHNDVLTGDGDGNTLVGNNGNDMLDGAGGDDTLVGGNGGDDFVGGAGTADTVNYNPEGDDLTITVDNVANDGATGELDNVHSDNEIITGGVGDDTITGSANAETLNGGTGNDTLTGVGGADVLNGGGGTDTASYAGGAGGTITLDNVANDPGGDDVRTENVIGGTGADDITGNAGVNRLDGGPGADSVQGSGGNDTLVGGADGAVDDYAGGAGRDTLTFAGVATNLDLTIGGVSGTDGDIIAGSVEVLTGGTGNDTLNGNASANTLNGGPGDDTLFGNDGNDVLNGQVGNDTLNGGAHTDTLNGGNGGVGDADELNGGIGIDTVRYSRDADVSVTIGVGANDGEAGEGDEVTAGVEKVFGGKGNDTLVGDVTGESLTGGAGDDTIDGRGGVDILSGQAGDDDLTGGGAKDTVSGGSGNDVFHTADGLKDSLNCGDGNDNIGNTDAIDSKTASCFP